MANLPTPPPAAGEPTNVSSSALVLPDLPAFRFPHPDPYVDDVLDFKLLQRDWDELHARTKAIRDRNSFGRSFVFDRPFRTSSSEEEIRRTFFEAENVLSRLIHVCCPDCRGVRIPFTPRSEELSPEHLTRDLFELEHAVNSITGCLGFQSYVTFRHDISPNHVEIYSFDPVTGVLGSIVFDISPAFPGGWGSAMQKATYYNAGKIYVIDTSDADPVNWFVESVFNTTPGLFTISDIRFVGPDGRYISYKARTTLNPTQEALHLIDTTNMTLVWTLTHNNVFGTDGDIVEYRFSPDGVYLGIIWSTANAMKVYRRSDGVELASFAASNEMAFSEDGEWFIRTSGGTTTQIPTSTWIAGLTNTISGGFDLIPYISPDSRFVAVSAGVSPNLGRVRFIDMSDMSTISTKNINNYSAVLTQGDWNQDGNVFMIADNNAASGGSVRSWVNPPTLTPGATGSGNRLDFGYLRPFH